MSIIETQKTEIRILTQSDWDSMYSTQDYKNKTQYVQTYTLHHLLAFNQPDNSILTFIEKIKNVCTLTLADPKNANLTPLLIATMRGRFKVVQVLFETYKTLGKSISDEKDKYGWTVLHHAKISSKEIFEFLCNKGIKSQARNRLCGTPDDLGALVGHELTPITAKRTFLQTGTGELISVSEIGKEKMKELMGINEYRDHPLYPETALKALWQLNEEGHTQMTDFFGAYSKNPPLLTIRPCMELGGHSTSLELCAGEDLSFGSIVCEYAGIVKSEAFYHKTFLESFNTEKMKQVEYLFGKIDAKDVGNAGRYANWGWPNVIVIEGVVKGTPRELLWIFAPEGIKKGEPLQIDYGIQYSSLAFGTQKLLGKNKMRVFFQECNLNDHVARLVQAKTDAKNEIDFDKLLKLDGLLSYLLYPLNNPTALLDLHFSGIIHARDWLEQWLEKEADFIWNWAEKYPGHCMSVLSLLQRLTEFDQVLSEQKIIKEYFTGWVIDSIGTFSVMQILKAIDLIVNEARKNKDILSESSWNKLKDDLENSIIQYDWTKDEMASLGLKRRRTDLLNKNKHLLDSGKISRSQMIKSLEAGLKYWANEPEKEQEENYQDVLYLVEELGLKEELFEMYEKDPS